MYNGIGLTTPRGSGTSGYVIRNLSTLRSHDPNRDRQSAWDSAPPKHREPDQGILEHERKRNVEVKCMELRVALEDEDIPEDEIEKQVDLLREKLLANLNAMTNPRNLKPTDTHAMAAAKKQELSKMARALGTRPDYKEGDAFDREKQEENKHRRIIEREEREQRREEDRKRMAEQKAKWAEERKERELARRADDDKRAAMPPPAIPTGPRRDRDGPPRYPDRGGYRRRSRSRSPPPPPRQRSSRSRSPPPRRRSPSRSRSRSRSPMRGVRRRYSRSRSPRRGRPVSRTPSRSRSRSISRSPSRSPSPRRRDSPPPPPPPRVPSEKARGRRSRSASTGSSMSVSTRSGSGSRGGRD